MKRPLSSAILLLISTVTYGQLLPDSVQLQNHRYVELYRSHTDMSYLAPNNEFGSPATYVLTGNLIGNFFLLASKQSRFALALTPDFTIRIRNEPSAPVRTPSYRIGARGFYRLTGRASHFRYVQGQVYHHSNGQDGEVFRPDGSVNTATGDFSTNYTQWTYHWGTHHRHRYGTHYATGVRWHAPFFNHSEGLTDNYGFVRVLGQAQYRRFRHTEHKVTTLRKSTLTAEWLRLNAQASYAVDHLNGWGIGSLKRRLNAEVSAYYIPPFSRDTGVFATVGYYGEDPYNIYFTDRYFFVRIGFTVGYLRYDEDLRK
jgi:hypothetical protein